MTFRMTDQVEVQREDDGTVRKLRHPTQPYAAEDSEAFALAAADEMSLRELADDYLREVMPIYGMESGLAENLDASFALAPEPDASPRLLYLEEQEMPHQASVAYAQTHMGLPVWQSGFLVKLAGSPPRVIGSQSSMDSGIDVELPPDDAAYDEDHLDAQTVAELLGLDSADGLTINGLRRIVYRLDAGDRGNAAGDPVAGDPDETAVDESMMHVAGPVLPVPDLPSELEDGKHYVVVEVLFSLQNEQWGDVHWGAFVEPRTGAMLRVDSFIGCLHHGQVYVADPPTRSGSNARPSSSAGTLDDFRERVELDGLTPAAGNAEQALEGEFVRLVDIQLPHVAPPTSPQGQDFDFSVPTDDFAGVNAYFHCDRLFRLLEGMGFDVGHYFDGTTFPVRVDHRFSYLQGGVLSGNVINASAPGNATRNGSDGFRFALLDLNSRVGIALHWRVVLHEFGHSILWDHVNSPNFRFAHSPGDSLAAILNDPGSRAPDRFFTFPFTPIARRHDRRPQDGWAWGGRRDDTVFPVGDRRSHDAAGYDREQILSSTLFRFYRAIGGDHTDPAQQEAAARYTAFLIFSAVGVLSRVVQPENAEDLAEGLMDADLATPSFEGRAGGAGHKVLRWAFEQQGAYQPPGAPSNVRTPGAPPQVDVYLDDGRQGTYEPAGSYLFSTDDVWNRRASDDGTTHQDPVAARRNFLYVRVRNRGTSTATGVRVETFTTRDGGDRPFPTAWNATDTPSAQAEQNVPSGGDAIVGPLAWTPAAEGSVSVLASAEANGDASNVRTLGTPLAAAVLAHLDNNVAGRMMRIVAADGDGGGNGDGDGDGQGTTVQAVAQPRLAIPDADPAGAVSMLHVSTEGTIARLGVGVTILHTFIGDLRVTLTSPAGTEMLFFEGRGLDQSEDDLRLTLSSNDDNALQICVGEGCAGTWSLRVVDRIGVDTGTLERWTLALVLEE